MTRTFDRGRSLCLFMIVASIDAIDLAVLPACFREIKSAFGIDQSALGILLFSRGISQALSAGIGGALGQRFARPLVLCCGCWTWGVGTLCVGLSPSYGAMLAAVALNGVGLGVIKPVIVSLIADLAPPGRVGRTFSVYDCVASVSTILGATVATVVAPLRIPFAPQLGECWRLIFAVLALIAALLGALIACCAREPRLDLRVRSAAVAAVELAPMDTVDSPRVRKNSGDARRASSGRCAVLCHEARAIACTTASAFRSVGRIPSFWVIIAQGGFGSMPWQSIGFLTLYFELGCYSNANAAGLNAIFRAGCAIGALVGGCVGDSLDARFPNHGRPCTALISVGSAAPFTLGILVLMAPLLGERDALAAFAASLFAMGLFCTWCAAGVNRPVMACVVKAELRPSIYAADAVLEGAMGSLGALTAGFLADALLGASTLANELESAHGGGDRATPLDASCAATKPSAIALGQALFLALNVPWAMCFAFYLILHTTYGRDRRKIAIEVGAEAVDEIGLAGAFNSFVVDDFGNGNDVDDDEEFAWEMDDANDGDDEGDEGVEESGGGGGSHGWGSRRRGARRRRGVEDDDAEHSTLLTAPATTMPRSTGL